MIPLAFLGFLEMSLADILDIILLGLIILLLSKEGNEDIVIILAMLLIM